MRGIRGAITVSKNNEKDILDASTVLLQEMIDANKINDENIVSIIFTATPDLNRVYPAVAARQLGYNTVPLMCYQELPVQNALEKVIRIMIYVNMECSLEEINHIYLREAKSLRPDLIQNHEMRRGER